MKAMSYFKSLFVKHGWYLMRPKVEIPEKTESACSESIDKSLKAIASHLCSTVTGERIIPQSLMRTLHRLLVLMVAVSSDGCCEAENCTRKLHGWGGEGGRLIGKVKTERSNPDYKGERAVSAIVDL
jgi:hypothetical protein